MTAGEILDRVDALRPNAYSPEQKLRWLRRLDGQILLELLETHEGAAAGGGNGAESVGQLPPAGEVSHCSHRGAGEGAPASLPASYDQQTELLAPFPWGEGVYIAGLFCQIDLHNGEIQKYNQSGGTWPTGSTGAPCPRAPGPGKCEGGIASPSGGGAAERR